MVGLCCMEICVETMEGEGMAARGSDGASADGLAAEDEGGEERMSSSTSWSKSSSPSEKKGNDSWQLDFTWSLSPDTHYK